MPCGLLPDRSKEKSMASKNTTIRRSLNQSTYRLFTPTLEELESRYVPSADFRWAPVAGQGFDWSKSWVVTAGLNEIDQTNFLVKTQTTGLWLRSGSLPTSGDNVYFGGWDGGRADCIVDKNVTVNSIAVGSDYLFTIYLKGSLQLLDGRDPQAPSKLDLASGAIAGYRDPGAGITRGTLNINSGTEFNWNGGTLSDLTVNIDGRASVGYRQNPNKKVAMKSTILNL